MKIYFQEKRRVLFFVRPSRGKGRVRRSQSRRGHLPVEREGNNNVNPKKTQKTPNKFASTQISTYLCGRIKINFMKTANYTDFRSNLKGYMDAVIDDCETVIINRGKDTGVVLISLDEYNSLKETEYIMSSPETVEAIRKGDEEIKNGKGIKVELEDLWK